MLNILTWIWFSLRSEIDVTDSQIHAFWSIRMCFIDSPVVYYELIHQEVIDIRWTSLCSWNDCLVMLEQVPFGFIFGFLYCCILNKPLAKAHWLNQLHGIDSILIFFNVLHSISIFFALFQEKAPCRRESGSNDAKETTDDFFTDFNRAGEHLNFPRPVRRQSIYSRSLVLVLVAYQ